MTALTDVAGVGPSAAEALQAAGINSAEELASASIDAITAAEGFGPAKAEKAKAAAVELMGSAEAPAADEPGENAIEAPEIDASHQAMMAATMTNAEDQPEPSEANLNRDRKKQKNKRKAQNASRRKNRKPKKKRR